MFSSPAEKHRNGELSFLSACFTVKHVVFSETSYHVLPPRPPISRQRNGSGSTAHAPADDPICCAEPSRPALPGLGCRWNYMGGSKVMGDPQMDGFIMENPRENPSKMDDNWGCPYFRKPPYDKPESPVKSSRLSRRNRGVGVAKRTQMKVNDRGDLFYPIY